MTREGPEDARTSRMTGTLLERVLERIRSAGPLPFEAFMRLALYDPEGGYYTCRVPGDGGDYGTSPSVSPWFGRLVARELRAMWEALGCPETFTVVEVGAGRADLAAAARAAAGPLAPALRWRFVEQFAEVRALQAARLGDSTGVEWSAQLAVAAGQVLPAAGCVLAHEVLDNFPVHLLEVAAPGTLREVHVDAVGGRLVECLGPLSDPRLAQAGRDAAESLPPGSRLEVCLQLEQWCRDAAGALGRGYLLVVDYGDREPDLWRNHRDGSLVTYGPAGFGEDPLADPGGLDVTAEVNFSAVERAARSAGFQPQLYTTQRDWLRSLGLDEVASELEAASDQAWAAGRNQEALELQGELSRLLTLVGRLGFGDIMVWRAAKDAALPVLPAGGRP